MIAGLCPTVTRRAWSGLVTAALVLGCAPAPVFDGAPCTEVTLELSVRDRRDDAIDLLFVIDGSPSMAQARERIHPLLARLVDIIVSGDYQARTSGLGVGTRDFEPPASLHVGVISSDGGGLGRAPPGPCGSVAGDDGRFVAACGHGFLDYEAGLAGPSAVEDQLDCWTDARAGTCGFEQPLEMMLKALQGPDFVPLGGPYRSGTPAHGGASGENRGFLRPDSLLIVVVISDEDDGSVADPSIFDPTRPVTPNDHDVRSALDLALLFDVDRYVEGLRALRPDPDRILFVTFAGVPPDLVDDESGASSLQAILADPRMQAATDPATGSLVPACTSTSGSAYPARRLVEVARRLDGVVESICQPDVDPILSFLSWGYHSPIRGICLDRPFVADDAGMVPCEVVEVLPGEWPHARCADGGLELVGTESSVDARGVTATREVCRVRQVGVAGVGGVAGGVRPGWVYDDGGLGWFSDLPERCGQRIALSAMELAPDAELRVRCTGTPVDDRIGPLDPACGP